MARLPAYEKFRLKRDRDFQARVLAALVKPPEKKRFWLFALINSAFFLWLMSAGLITAGGAALSAHRQCLSDADKASQDYMSLTSELDDRILYISSSLQRAHDMDDLKRYLVPFPHFSSALKGVDLGELFWRRIRILKMSDAPVGSLEPSTADNWIRIEQYRNLVTDLGNGLLDRMNFKSLSEFYNLNSDLETSDEFAFLYENCNISSIFFRYVIGSADENARILKVVKFPFVN